MVVSVEGVHKSFNRSVVLRDITFSLNAKETLLITGRNGSGKSTLSKMLVDLLSPTGGRITLHPERNPDERHLYTGFVAPYLQLFEEFTAREHLIFAWKLRARSYEPSFDRHLSEVGLGNRPNDPVRTFSSGMKQRLKYAIAISHRPSLLVLDEPMANLDEEGVTVVRRIMEHQISHGALVVATNDRHEVQAFDQRVNLDDK